MIKVDIGAFSWSKGNILRPGFSVGSVQIGETEYSQEGRRSSKRMKFVIKLEPELLNWFLDNNIEFHWELGMEHVEFQSETDAVHFKMRWL